MRSRAFVDSDELLCRFGGATLDDDDEESDRGVTSARFVSSSELECIVPRASGGRPGAVALAVLLNGGTGFDGGDSSSVPGALAFEYVESIVMSSLAPRAERRAPARRAAASRSVSSARLRALARALMPDRRHRERRRHRGDRRVRVLLSIQLCESARRRRRCGARILLGRSYRRQSPVYLLASIS